MPVEIEELIVRIVVEPQGSETAPRGGPEGASGASRDQLVQQVVDQVLEILRQREER